MEVTMSHIGAIVKRKINNNGEELFVAGIIVDLPDPANTDHPDDFQVQLFGNDRSVPLVQGTSNVVWAHFGDKDGDLQHAGHN